MCDFRQSLLDRTLHKVLKRWHYPLEVMSFWSARTAGLGLAALSPLDDIFIVVVHAGADSFEARLLYDTV